MTAGSTFTIAGLSADHLRDLRRWLIDDGTVRGPFELRHAGPRPGEMGSLTDALVVAAGSGGAITALAGVLISWLRHRTSDVTVKVTRPDGTAIEISASRVRDLDGSALGTEITRLTGALEAGPQPAALEGDAQG